MGGQGEESCKYEWGVGGGGCGLESTMASGDLANVEIIKQVWNLKRGSQPRFPESPESGQGLLIMGSACCAWKFDCW